MPCTSCNIELSLDEFLTVIIHGGSSDRTLAFVMATIQLQTPPPFNFKTTDDWPRWRRRFEQFRVASGLGEQSAAKQKQNFDSRHRTKPLPDIPDDTEVWVTTDGQPVTGRVATHATAPRLYVVNTSSSTIRRNRSQINVVPNATPPSSSTPSQQIRKPIITRSRTGTLVAPPKRL